MKDPIEQKIEELIKKHTKYRYRIYEDDSEEINVHLDQEIALRDAISYGQQLKADEIRKILSSIRKEPFGKEDFIVRAQNIIIDNMINLLLESTE